MAARAPRPRAPADILSITRGAASPNLSVGFHRRRHRRACMLLCLTNVSTPSRPSVAPCPDPARPPHGCQPLVALHAPAARASRRSDPHMRVPTAACDVYTLAVSRRRVRPSPPPPLRRFRPPPTRRRVGTGSRVNALAAIREAHAAGTHRVKGPVSRGRVWAPSYSIFAPVSTASATCAATCRGPSAFAIVRARGRRGCGVPAFCVCRRGAGHASTNASATPAWQYCVPPRHRPAFRNAPSAMERAASTTFSISSRTYAASTSARDPSGRCSAAATRRRVQNVASP